MIMFSTTDTFTFCLFSLCFSICTNKKFVVVQQRHFWNSASLRPSFSLNCCFLLSYFKTSTTKTEETFFRDLSYLCERNVGIVAYMWPGFYEFMKFYNSIHSNHPGLFQNLLEIKFLKMSDLAPGRIELILTVCRADL